MKITSSTPPVKTEDALILCFDVSGRTLNLYSQWEDNGRTLRLEDEIPNATVSIEHLLHRCEDVASEAGLDNLVVLCESTGGYERKLLSTARRFGHRTGLINPEHVAKFKTIESNDTGKTDHKDPRVMHLVARLGKVQTHRHLPEIYRRLRRLTAYYEDDEAVLTSVRQRIRALVSELFLDYDKPVAFTFSSTGAALMDAYAFNPYAIVRAGYSRFEQKMKRRVRSVRFATLEHLYEAAEASVRHRRSAAEEGLFTTRLRMLWADFERLTRRREALRADIEALGKQLQDGGALPHIDHLKGLTLFNLARLAGETGPLEDFSTKRTLLRYAGLNIRERTSGTYFGQNRISKKGRPLLRKLLGQTTFALLQRDRLYGPYYRRKIEEGMLAQKAKVAVMRKFFGMLLAITRSGAAFDPQRFTHCESQYQLAA